MGYKEDAIIYTDLINHWAKDYIEFVTSNGLMEGTTESAFGPNEYITRADFLKALVKLYGADISGYKTSRFIDVKDNDPYLPYIEWAADMQIVKGIGNNMFGPDRNIKRQDMAVMMQNLAKATGYDLAKLIPELEFSDHDKIDDYAKDAVRTIQEAAIMQGKGNNIFDPQGNTTRAEAAVILKRFSELVIDKGVVRGWSQNEAGEWQYVDKYGRPVTGWFKEGDLKYYFNSDGVMVSARWMEIEGKWYYFYEDGSLAINTKIDGYQIDENGVRKAK